MVLKTELNASNKFEAINTLAIPVATYSFNIINWKMSDFRRMDAKTRKMLTTAKMHHPKSDVDWLYLPTTSGGRSLALGLYSQVARYFSSVSKHFIDYPTFNRWNFYAFCERPSTMKQVVRFVSS